VATTHDADRSRQLIRRVLALPPDRLPPGPSDYRRCECGELVGTWPEAQAKHRPAHARLEREAERRTARERRRQQKATLRQVNRLRRETERVLAETGRGR
jgi:hypothetical protein